MKSTTRTCDVCRRRVEHSEHDVHAFWGWYTIRGPRGTADLCSLECVAAWVEREKANTKREVWFLPGCHDGWQTVSIGEPSEKETGA